MEVKVVSTEIVKPSSPTADHLKTYKLSSIDQTSPRIYIPTFFFYESNPEEVEESSRRSQLLKLSLSRLLTFFYPFAGTINDDLSIICDDRGVPFTLANANFPLVDFLRQPDYGRLPSFFPEQLEKDPAGCQHVGLVQLTHFTCGGFVLSAAISHLIADASSISFFLKSWAAMHRHDDDPSSFSPKPPIFDASSLFPPADRVPEEVRRGGLSIQSLTKQVTMAKRRLVYGPAAVRALKEKAASPSVPNPTRAQVVSAHLAKCIMSVSEGRSKSMVLTHAVNLRRRSEPPFPEELIGNLVWIAVVPHVNAHETHEAQLVKQIQEAISKIDEALVKRMSGAGADTVFREKRNYSGAAPGSELIVFTSRCNMGLYGVDFGWGKPIWVTNTGGPPIGTTARYANLVGLMDTRCRDGVQANLLLDEALMAALERSPDLLAYATFDENPLLHQDQD